MFPKNAVSHFNGRSLGQIRIGPFESSEDWFLPQRCCSRWA